MGPALPARSFYDNCSPDPAAEVGTTTVCTACPYGTKFPFLSNIGILNNTGVSNYNALQITLNERPTHGLSFLAAYTFSHALDDISLANASGQSGPIDGYNTRLNYGPADFNNPNRFTFSPSTKSQGSRLPGRCFRDGRFLAS